MLISMRRLISVLTIACGLVGLCYAELSAFLPVSGSSYTYTYATLGELAAWVIGWDLILEYAMGSAAVAVMVPRNSRRCMVASSFQCGRASGAVRSRGSVIGGGGHQHGLGFGGKCRQHRLIGLHGPRRRGQ